MRTTMLCNMGTLLLDKLHVRLAANSPSKWGHDLFDEISKDEEAPAKEGKEVESADVTAMDE